MELNNVLPIIRAARISFIVHTWGLRRKTEMDTTTLLIIVLLILLIGGGGWYGRGRWY